MTINNKLLRNLLITGFGRLGGMTIQFITTIILSHFLSPSDFGIVAMCSIFMSISEMLIDSGMAGSIVFYKDVKEIELHTLFWTNFTISLFIYIILYISAKKIALFYNVPQLEQIITIIAISIVIHSLCIIQNALLTKNLLFEIQSSIMISSSVISSFIAIGLAYCGFGIWSLVSQPISMKIIQVLLYIKNGKYTPKLQYSFYSLRRHWHFGSRLLGTSFMKTLYDNLYIQIIAKTASLQNAGYYFQAKKFNDMPNNLLMFSLDKVIFPSLAKSKNIIPKMENISLIFSLTIIPILFYGALISKQVISIVLGEKWSNSGWMLSYMLIGSVGAILETLNRSFIKATGKTGILLKYDTIKRFLNTLIILLLFKWSIKGLLIALIINGAISWVINCIALKKAINFSLFDQTKDTIIILVISITPFILLNNFYFDINSVWLEITFYFFTYFVVYFALLFTVKRKYLISLLTTIKSKRDD